MLSKHKLVETTRLFIKNGILIICLFITNKTLSQELIKGRIVSKIDNYKEIQIINQNNNLFININKEGVFEIKASLNDTIKISSHSYEEANFIVREKHFHETIEIHLNDRIEKLNEIVIDNYTINDTELAKINLELQNQIKNDIKNNPYKYEVPDSGGNLLGVFVIAAQLFKKKKPEKKEIEIIKHQDLVGYFKNDQSFLIDELNIPKNQISSFFLFIEDQQVPADLLTKSNTFFFLEELTQKSNEFFKNTKP